MPVHACIDQLGREIQIPVHPRKIISLVPSQTELLFDLGLNEEIMAVTKFCIYPEEKVKSKIRIGGTKNLNIEKIKSLRPDLIIGNKEENDEEQIKELMKEFTVWISDIQTTGEAYAMIDSVGKITGKQKQADRIIKDIRVAIRNFQLSKTDDVFTAAYLIWNEPMMTTGNNTFIHHMLGIAGFKNVFNDLRRYPEIGIQDLKLRSPQFLLLSSEPFPFSTKHAEEFEKLLSQTKILLVDGEMFSWYGSRMVKSISYFEHLHLLIKEL
ncbi:MAG: helical backbone metal receptor [Chitinophagales bacterium]